MTSQPSVRYMSQPYWKSTKAEQSLPKFSTASRTLLVALLTAAWQDFTSLFRRKY